MLSSTPTYPPGTPRLVKPEDPGITTLYVGGLDPVNIKEADIKDVFYAYGEIKFARLGYARISVQFVKSKIEQNFCLLCFWNRCEWSFQHDLSCQCPSDHIDPSSLPRPATQHSLRTIRDVALSVLPTPCTTTALSRDRDARWAFFICGRTLSYWVIFWPPGSLGQASEARSGQCGACVSSPTHSSCLPQYRCPSFRQRFRLSVSGSWLNPICYPFPFFIAMRNNK